MNRRVRLLSAVYEELAHAVHWYEERRNGLGGEFLEAVVATVESIDAQPGIGVTIADDTVTRRVRVAQYPYFMVYRVAPGELVIIAIAHMRRRPGFWRERL